MVKIIRDATRGSGRNEEIFLDVDFGDTRQFLPMTTVAAMHPSYIRMIDDYFSEKAAREAPRSESPVYYRPEQRDRSPERRSRTPERHHRRHHQPLWLTVNRDGRKIWIQVTRNKAASGDEVYEIMVRDPKVAQEEICEELAIIASEQEGDTHFRVSSQKLEDAIALFEEYTE